MYAYSAEVAFNLRKEFGFLDDDFDEEPVNNSHVTFGNFELVGHGKVTNEFCGKYLRFKGCLRVDLHNRIRLDGKSFKNKIFTRKVHHYCHKPSCPVCMKHGWAIRQAGNIEGRLAESSKRFGQVQHVICSVPASDYGLDLPALRKKAQKVLVKRGVIGGNLIWHGLRFNLRKQWYYSPHFHVLGHILGGYSRCRHCKRKWNCLAGCGNFDDNAYQKFLKDGWYVKVLGKRKTVFGTAWYQLHHATIDVTKKRFHVSTWFGVCSYRKLKVTVEKRKALCPICMHDLVAVVYHGVKAFITDKNAPDYERDCFEDYEEKGRAVWVLREPREHGSGS